MERLCFIINIYEGTEKEYDQRHDDIWPDMAQACADAGFSNYSIFRVGTQVIGYAECIPDIASVFAKMSTFEVEGRWNDSLSNVIKGARGGESGVTLVPEVWHLKAVAKH